MQPTAFVSPASSATPLRCLGLLLCGCVGALLSESEAANRPRYGGTLRVKMQGAIRSLDPVNQPASPSERTGKNRITASIFEGLTRLRSEGTVEPCLAVSWQFDRNVNKWWLSLRPGVKLHDGTLLTPATVSDALNVAMKGIRASVAGDSIVIQSERPVVDLPRRLAQSQYAIFVRTANGLTGTGPFRIAEWQSGRRLKLTAHEAHWEGRPFVDAVEIEMVRPCENSSWTLNWGRLTLSKWLPIRSKEQASVAFRSYPLFQSNYGRWFSGEIAPQPKPNGCGKVWLFP